MAALLALGSGLLLLGKLSPERYKLWLQEDGPLEWLTVWSFLLAACIFVAVAYRKDDRLDRAMAIALAAFCVFVAGEELSSGQRLFTFQPPELFLDKNFQQEANLHNLLKGIFDSRWQVFLIAFGYGVVAPLAAWRRWLPASLAPHAATVIGGAAVALVELSYPVELSGEVAEAMLGLFFVHDAATRLHATPAVAGRLALALSGGAALAAVLMPPALDATLYRADPERVARAKAELAALALHLEEGGAKARLARKRRVHKRVYTAVRARYLSAPAAADTTNNSEALRLRYQLDPWQQPYWLLFSPDGRDHGEALLYSFGPNRRRDTLMQQLPSELAGDDIGVWVRPSLSPK